MPKIKISELRPVGSELFQDSESYLNELNEEETQILGGKAKNKFVITTVIEVVSQLTQSQGISLATFSAVTKV
jgi:hypothetical protein